MQIDIAPETERLVRDEIRSGHFQSADEVIRAGVEALREKNVWPAAAAVAGYKSLVQFFRESPLVGLELDFERDQDPGRDITL
jgi:Arc/MetJ-type ribon-helix-helix transcriptional regulator